MKENIDTSFSLRLNTIYPVLVCTIQNFKNAIILNLIQFLMLSMQPLAFCLFSLEKFLLVAPFIHDHRQKRFYNPRTKCFQQIKNSIFARKVVFDYNNSSFTKIDERGSEKVLHKLELSFILYFLELKL